MFKLKAKRVEKGIKLKDMALMVGISQAYLVKIEKGEIEPRRNIMYKISQILEGTVEELFFYDLVKERE